MKLTIIFGKSSLLYSDKYYDQPLNIDFFNEINPYCLIITVNAVFKNK